MKKFLSAGFLLLLAMMIFVPSCFAENSITVSTVDELLAAIAPNAKIVLREGEYDLSAASDYGKGGGEYYIWNEVYDGYELLIRSADGISLSTERGAKVSLSALPRYANVLAFENTKNITLNGLTLGHTVEPGFCSGGVLWLNKVQNAEVNDCALFGCGTIGINAYQSRNIYASNCEIYDCSQNAVMSENCKDVRLLDSRVHNCEGELFRVNGTEGFAVVNSVIENNNVSYLLSTAYSSEVYLLGCDTKDNYFSEAAFRISGLAPTVDKCSLHNNNFMAWFNSSMSSTPGVRCIGLSGAALSNIELEEMECEACDYEGPVERKAEVSLVYTEGKKGRRSVTVTNVDEFLAAIAPKVDIIVDCDELDLSAAVNYGMAGSDFYRWENGYDGPALMIYDVEDMSITSKTATLITAVPRYADVLSFQNCEDVSLKGLTLGHSELPEPYSCTGGVLYFSDCEDIEIDRCRLYGCGILGISTYRVEELKVSDTEIYDCSQGAVNLVRTTDSSFENCYIHDCAKPEITLVEGDKVKYKLEDEKACFLKNGYYTLTETGVPEEWNWELEADVMDSIDPSSIQVTAGGENMGLLSMETGETVELSAYVTLSDRSNVRTNQIVWVSPDESKLEFDENLGQNVKMTSHLEPGEVMNAFVYYLRDGFAECSETIMVMGQ